MKKLHLILFFCVVTNMQLFAQRFLPPIFYNGIDTFFIGDKKVKYINTEEPRKFTLIQTDTLQGHIISYHNYRKDSITTYKIDTISFRNMFFSFNDSVLASIDLFNLYRVKDYENAVVYVEGKIKFLKKYISEHLHKKGKFKKFVTTNTYRHYGYEWTKDDYIINLIIQFEVPTSRFISLDLYIASKKLTVFY